MKGWERSMFISLNKMKGLIIELDSFSEEFDEKWDEIKSSIPILFLSDNKERLLLVKEINSKFLTYEGTLTGLFKRRKNLLNVLRFLKIESYEVVVLSRNLETLKYIQEMNVSTIHFSEESYIKFEFVGNLSDFIISNIGEVNQIISGNIVGYFSEAAATLVYNASKLEFDGLVVVTKKVYKGIESIIVSGGRYFSTNDNRYPVHQLSQRIIRNKKYHHTQVSLFSTIYNNLIRFIESQFGKVDALTRIPPRPLQPDRLIECVNSICNIRMHIQDVSKSLKCIRDYKSQRFLNQEQRQLNVKGVFEVSKNFDNKHIVILDDVVTTGSTALEAANEFYKAGAKKVTILTLAINQFKKSFNSHIPLTCQCGSELIMRFNKKNNSAFFGCINYQFCGSLGLDFIEGVQKYNNLNRVDLSEKFNDQEWLF